MPLLVMEAMKMEQTITAPKDGTISKLDVKPGDQVADGTILVVVDDNE
jgi:3-methylcrotonyl-CoA carboxylase alpha subunit